MAKQTINPGTAPTGAGGDTFRSGSAKLQANDDELYDFIGGAANTTTLPSALPLTKGGTGATTAAAARTNLGLGAAATRGVGTSIGNVMEVGAFGVGSQAQASNITGNHTFQSYFDQMYLGGSGFHRNDNITGEAATNTANASRVLYATMLFAKGGDTSFALWSDHIAGRIGYMVRLGTDTTTNLRYGYLLTSTNTVKDANGFIKAASPIVKLFADGIKLNDEAKQQEIVFEKLGIGEYLIKGSSGFAQEGWYVETPKDANGNVLFSVIYTTLENGDISVKTYKKKFDLETASIVADLAQPVDITANRWIDLRLQEIEVTDDPEQ